MLTLLTVGTHQPYSAPEDYLQRYEMQSGIWMMPLGNSSVVWNARES